MCATAQPVAPRNLRFCFIPIQKQSRQRRKHHPKYGIITCADCRAHRMPTMNRLQGMEFFVEVAKTCNFSRAAISLGMPKSTVSRQVAELERSLGLQLLSRTTRKVELTEAGKLYFERCQRIVAEAQVAHEELQKLVEMPSGPLRVNKIGRASCRARVCQ